MKQFFILNMLIISVMCGSFEEPNEWQVADAAWLSNQIYSGVNTMDTASGYVLDKHESKYMGAYAVWKQKTSGDCYVVIRGTSSLSDIFTDLNVEEYYDSEIEAYVHSGVRGRALFIINNIGDKLKYCTQDITVTGHSLGGSIAYYLYLLYIKRHKEDWGQTSKAYRFKAVLFSAPALTSNTKKANLMFHDVFVHWYKYGRDGIPFIIYKVKGSLSFEALSNLFKSIGLSIVKRAYDIVQTVNYGYYHPGRRFLLKNGIKREYRFDDPYGFDYNAINDHMDFKKSVDILTKIWG